MKRVLSTFSLLFCVALAVSVSAQATPQGAGQGTTQGTGQGTTQGKGQGTTQGTGQGKTAPTGAAKIGSDADYATHMKEIGQLNGMLNKAIKGGDAAEGGKAAARLEILFKNVHGYWTDKKIADATEAAQTAVTSLQAVQKALSANDMAAAETARATFAGTCMTCHTAHREKLPEGGFRIK